MPEAFAVLAVFVVVIAAWIGAWMQGRDPANANAADERARLEHHAAWLEQRLDVARREKWGDDMEASLSAELQMTLRQLGGQAD